jgi:diguanylate cyclase (GGDEF)-like protein
MSAPSYRVEETAPALGGLAELPVAVLITGPANEIEFANAAARSLFAPIAPVGLGLRTLFALSGASGGAELAAAIAQPGAGASSRVGLADGRWLQCSCGPDSGGGSALVFVDVSEHVRAGQLAAHDALTSLTNRAALNERLSVLLARESGLDAALAVLCIDLDRFKAVNDTLGHPIGDALLKKVAERLRSAVKPGDVVARLGGDEFAIVQVDVEQPQGAEALAARLVDLLGRSYILEGHMVNIGASVGVALAPADGSDPDTLLKRADLALYCAKADGRGMFRRFASEMDAGLQARRSLEIDLRRALALREFELVYQPQVHLASNEIVGFEALLRWRTPTRGVVPPLDFIPLSEEIGLIVPIGEWVLRTACHEAASWPKSVSVAVNLSPVQFRSGRLVKTVVSALASSGLEPTRLELEITEGALLENTESVIQSLQALKALGVRISMDDFGTGLLFAELPAEISLRQDQDRPILRAGHGRQPRLRSYRPRGRGARREPRHEDDGGGRGDGRPARPHPGRGLQRSPRLPDRPPSIAGGRRGAPPGQQFLRRVRQEIR